MATDHRRVDAQLAKGTMLDEPGFLRQIVGRVLQELLEAEITEHIGAAPYERSVTRKGRRNGCKPRTLRTINGLERLNQEIKRRTRAVRIFPNREACLRLVSLAVEQSEEWVTGRRYLDMRELKEHRWQEREAEGAMLMER